MQNSHAAHNREENHVGAMLTLPSYRQISHRIAVARHVLPKLLPNGLMHQSGQILLSRTSTLQAHTEPILHYSNILITRWKIVNLFLANGIILSEVYVVVTAVKIVPTDIRNNEQKNIDLLEHRQG